MRKVLLGVLAPLVFVHPALAQSAAPETVDGIDAGKTFSSQFENNPFIGRVGYDAARAGFNGYGLETNFGPASGDDPLMSLLAGCKDGKDCSKSTIVSRSTLTQVSAATMDRMVNFPTFKGINSWMKDPSAKHFLESAKSRLVKATAMLEYSDPALAHSVISSRHEAVANSTRTANALETVASLSEKNPTFNRMFRGFLACIQRRLNDFGGDSELAAAACWGDKPEAGAAASVAAMTGVSYSINDDDPVAQAPVTESKRASVGPRDAAARKRGELVDELTGGGADTATMKGARVLRPSDQGPRDLMHRVFAPLMVGRSGHDLRLLERTKATYIQLAGNVEWAEVDPAIFSAAMAIGQVSPFNQLVTILGTRAAVQQFAQGNLKVVVERETQPKLRAHRLFAQQLEATWRLLVNRLESACRDRATAEGNDTVLDLKRESRGSKPYFPDRMREGMTGDPVADLSIQGVSLTPTSWDLLMWLTTQGRSVDKLKEGEGSCSELAGLVDQLETFRKQELEGPQTAANSIDRRRYDMKRAIFWYSAFVATGKTYETYLKLHSFLLSVALRHSTNNQAEHDDTVRALNLLESALGKKMHEVGTLSLKNAENFQSFLERLRRYRQASFSSRLLPARDERQTGGVDEMSTLGAPTR